MSNIDADKTYAVFPNNNNRKIVSKLEESGAQVIKFPAIETEINADINTKELTENLTNFDWVIFTDVLTVDFFLEILENNAFDFFDLDEIRVCALGEIVSDRLRFVQVHADVIPNTVETETVLPALENYIGAEEFSKLKFLLLNQIDSDSEIKSELLKTGAQVLEVPLYLASFSNDAEISKLKALLMGGAIDEFIFTAPTDFIALKNIFKKKPLAEILSEIKISAHDGQIYQTLREHNLKSASFFQIDKIDKV